MTVKRSSDFALIKGVKARLKSRLVNIEIAGTLHAAVKISERWFREGMQTPYITVGDGVANDDSMIGEHEGEQNLTPIHCWGETLREAIETADAVVQVLDWRDPLDLSADGFIVISQQLVDRVRMHDPKAKRWHIVPKYIFRVDQIA